ncbi:MAG: LPS export ABC transporter periplasmic protein LptC [Candidatus Omnitrophota bacterium]
MIFKSFLCGTLIFMTACSVTSVPGWCADGASASGAEKQEMSDFSLSGFGDKGKKSWDITGKSADIGTEVIKLNDIVSNFYGAQDNVRLTAENGDFNRREGNIHLQDDVVMTTTSGARMTTDALDWDRKQQIVQTDRAVKVEKSNMVITGQGAKGFPDLNKLNLDKDVRVGIDEAPATEAAKKGLQKIVITCDGSLQVDYKKNIATFNDNVRVVTADGVITGDQMELFFKSQGAADASPRDNLDDISAAGSKIDRILARGNVTITRGPNISHSDEATYSAMENKITLSGRPKLIIYSSEGLNAPVRN